MRLGFVISTCLVSLLLCDTSMAQDCIDYADYLHWFGGLDTPADAYNVTVSGRYAYITAESNLLVIDILDPYSMIQVGSVPIPDTGRCVAVSGSYAYIAANLSGLQVVDISNPFLPVLIGSVDTPSEATDVAISGSYAYVADFASGLRVIDVHDPFAPNLIGGVDTSGHALGVAVSGNYAYVADNAQGLRIADISVPGSPVLISGVDTPSYARNVAISGGYAYVADEDYGLMVVDILDPYHPVLSGSIYTQRNNYDIAVSDGFAYIAADLNGMHVVDVSDPLSPIWTGTANTPGNALRLAVWGGCAYIADNTSGLQAFDISDPIFGPALAGSLDTPGSATKVAISGSYAHVADGSSGLQVVNISNPASPVIMGSVDTSGSAQGVAVADSYAYVADGSSGLQVVSVSNPASPVIVGSVDTPGNAYGVAVSGIYAYVADGSSGLQVVNISNPASPVIVGSVDTPVSAQGVAVSDSYAYVADGYSGLQVVNISNPAGPVIVGSANTPGTAQGVGVSGSYAYVADGSSGLQVVNISNPTSPVIMGSVDTPGNAYGVAVSGIYAYVADGSSGLLIAYRQCDDAGGEPLLLTPADLSTVTTCEIPFSWSDSAADFYQLFVDDDPDFSSPQVSPFHLAPMHADSIFGTSFPWGCNWLPAGQYHWKVRAWQGSQFAESDVWTFDYEPPVAQLPAWGPLYRLYNDADTDHFYCSSENHSQIAEDQGYREERVEGFISHQRFAGPDSVEIYRFYNGDLRTHYYTALDEEVDPLILAGWLYEGIVGYAYGSPLPGLVPLYHLVAPEMTDHLYTCSQVERDHVQTALDFVDAGIMCYVSPNGDTPLLPGALYSALLGNGISAGTGNFNFHQTTSFEIPSIGLPLNFSHLYNSSSVHLLSQIMPLGPGWSHTYNAYVLTIPGQWLVVWPDGSIHRYSQETGACLEREQGVYDTMEVLPAGKFEITKKDQVIYTFERAAGAPTDYPSMLTAITDRNGNRISCEYEPSGLRRLLAVTCPAGRRLTFEYAGQEQAITRVNDEAGGRSIQFAFEDDNGNLTRFTDCAGGQTQYMYDNSDPLLGQDHQLTSIVLPRGNRVDCGYEARKIRSMNWSGNSGAVTLSYGGNRTEVTDNEGRLAVFTFDGQGRVDSIIDQSGDTGSMVLERSDPSNPALPTRVKDRRGNVTEYSYDARGNTLTILRPLGVAEAFEFDTMNNLTRYVDPLGADTEYGYDAAGNLATISDPLGHTTSYTRFGNGLVETLTNPLGHVTHYEYDAYGNRTAVIDNLGNHTSFDYNAVGNLTRFTDAAGHATSYSYDCAGRMTSATDPEGGQTAYTYDANGNRVSVRNARGHETTWTFDDRDLLISTSNPVGNSTGYTYNDDGTLASRSRPTGTTTYSYDATGRLAGISSSGASFTRDNNGNITDLADDNGTMAYDYDALNRLISTTDYFGNTVGYEYNTASNLLEIAYPGNKLVHYTYYPNHTLHTVTDWLGGTTTYTYRADDSIASVVYPNGMVTTYSYDQADRLTGMKHSKSSGEVVAEYIFTLNVLGNIVTEERVEPLEPPQLPGTEIFPTYDAANRVLQAGSATYQFDGAGNMLVRTGPMPLACTYNLENRLTSVSGSFTASYLYDTFGHRRAATRQGQTRHLVLDVQEELDRVLVETDAAGIPLAYYVYGLGLLARIDATGTRSHYHFNNLGSTVANTDADEDVVQAFAYDPLGSTLGSLVPAEDDRVRFVGEQGVTWEGDGLYYMRARFYDSQLGRFLSEDPVMDANLYQYAENNPLRFIDPQGTFSWFREEEKQLGRAFGGAFGQSMIGGLLGDFHKDVITPVLQRPLDVMTLKPLVDTFTGWMVEGGQQIGGEYGGATARVVARATVAIPPVAYILSGNYTGALAFGWQTYRAYATTMNAGSAMVNWWDVAKRTYLP